MKQDRQVLTHAVVIVRLFSRKFNFIGKHIVVALP